MSELELALTRLGRELDYPATPDLTGAVRRRIAGGRRPSVWRRPVVIAVAVLAVGLAAVMAVPQARSQIFDWLGIGAATVRYVDELPKTEPTSTGLGLGERETLANVRGRVGFDVRVPTLEGLEEPAVYFLEGPGMVSFLYGSEDEPRLVISQLSGTGALEKLVGTGTDVELVSAGEAEGAWLEGAEHVLFFPGLEGPQEPRLVGNTLLMQRRDFVTVRIEADVDRDEALRIFRSMRGPGTSGGS